MLQKCFVYIHSFIHCKKIIFRLKRKRILEVVSWSPLTKKTPSQSSRKVPYIPRQVPALLPGACPASGLPLARRRRARRRREALPPGGGAVPRWVERFDRRGSEPFEPFRSEYGQNSFKIQEFLPENSKISEKFNIF